MDLAFPLSPVGPVARFTVSKLSIYIIKDFINFSTGINGVFVNFCKLFSNCLDDSVLEERTVGIQMGLELMELCSEVWVFGPPTEGMKFEIAKAEELGITIKFHDQKGQVDYDNH